ncbi:MAG: hypothetical protein H0V24_09670, partial [Chloroflexia bacterium]|nr:hypothetical protein [Chloroflexia bacterium]
MSEAAAGYRFLSGAAMEPEAILAAYPGSRFVARAHVMAADNEIWGILIHLATPDPAGDAHDVTTDDGRTFTALVSNDGHPTG